MNNKTRANSWERQASKLLSLWVSNGDNNKMFWRTNSSGAKGTISKDKNHGGDITAVDPSGIEFAGLFHIECKWKKDFSYCDMGTIQKWLREEGKKARDHGKCLFMIVKGWKGDIYVILCNKDFQELRAFNIPVSDKEYMVFDDHIITRVQEDNNG